jgi:hypothetical protein
MLWRCMGEWGIDPSLTSALVGAEWSASRHGLFNPGERAPSTHWIGGWAGLTAGMYVIEERLISCPYRQRNPGCPARNPLLYRQNCFDSWITDNVVKSTTNKRSKGFAIVTTPPSPQFWIPNSVTPLGIDGCGFFFGGGGQHEELLPLFLTTLPPNQSVSVDWSVGVSFGWLYPLWLPAVEIVSLLHSV